MHYENYLHPRLICCYVLKYILAIYVLFGTVRCAPVFMWLNQVCLCKTYHEISSHQSIQVNTSQLIKLCLRNRGISRKWPSLISYLQGKFQKKKSYKRFLNNWSRGGFACHESCRIPRDHQGNNHDSIFRGKIAFTQAEWFFSCREERAAPMSINGDSYPNFSDWSVIWTVHSYPSTF